MEKGSKRATSMESSLRNILHSNEADFDPQFRPRGPLSVPDQASASSFEPLEADNALPESKKRAATRIKSSYPRKRAIQACQKCRVRRTKCNNERPSCSSCLAIGAECTYTEGDHSRYVFRRQIFGPKAQTKAIILTGTASILQAWQYWTN